MKSYSNQFKNYITAAMIVVIAYGMTACGGGSLKDGNAPKSGKMFSIEEVFKMLAHENHVARTLYTSSIVGPGKAAGLAFDEDWRKDEVEAGPLPALFLRSTSSQIQRTTVPLGLYLGSDFPINKANKFEGQSMDLFQQIKSDHEPKFFYDEENEVHTAMFPDFAGAKPCVSCHNEHPETPKSDWELGDVMGATTWTFPEDSVTFEQAQSMIMAYRDGAKKTFAEYIAEIEGFKESEKPEIGDKWPIDGLYIPSPEVFMDSVKTLSSKGTLALLIKD